MSRKTKRARRVRGSGSVFSTTRRGVEVWIARKPVGTTASGNTQYREASAPTATEALEKLAQLESPGPLTTVRQWCERWLESLDVRSSTRDSYENSVHLFHVPTLGHIRLADLTPFQVEAAVAKWGRGHTPATVGAKLSALRTCLAAAVRAGVCPSNAAANARKPRQPARVVEMFSPDELRAIVREGIHVHATRINCLLATTGLRIGEAAGLDVQDYDTATGMLSITKTYHERHGMGPCKSSRSERVIRVPEAGRPAILAAAAGRKRGVLFTSTRAGTRINRHGVVRPFQKMLQSLGIPYRSFHAMRHASISNQLAAGFAVADVAKYHGNTPAVVMAVYCHPSGADPSEAMDVLFGAS